MSKVPPPFSEAQKTRHAIIMNAVDTEGARIVLHAVPTRAFRVIALKDERTFRVEQLDSTTWKWFVLSTHMDDKPWEAVKSAMLDCMGKQEEFTVKIRTEINKQKQAERLAAATLPGV